MAPPSFLPADVRMIQYKILLRVELHCGSLALLCNFIVRLWKYAVRWRKQLHCIFFIQQKSRTLNSEKYLREAAFLLHAELRLERLSNCTMIFFFEYLLDFQNSYPTDDL